MSADYETMQPGPVEEQNSAMQAHTCCVCGYQWSSANLKDARKVQEAAKANRDGPYCILCLHLEMAARYAEARGYKRIRQAMNDWRAFIN